jgi:ABC-type transporter Mla MlaB component
MPEKQPPSEGSTRQPAAKEAGLASIVGQGGGSRLASFEVRISFDSAVVVVALKGRLTAETAPTLQLVMDTLVDAVAEIDFDFAGLHTVDDGGVDGLERCMNDAQKAGYRVGIRNAGREPVREAVRIA